MTPDTASNISRTSVPKGEIVGISSIPGVDVGVVVAAGVPVKVGVAVAAGVTVIVGVGTPGVAVDVTVGVGLGGGVGVPVACPNRLIEPANRNTTTSRNSCTNFFRIMMTRTLLSAIDRT